MSLKKLSELFDLSGQVAIVTGGSNGIGQGIVKRLSEAGATVVIVDINEIGSEKAQDICAIGGKCLFKKMDVRNEEDVKRVIEEVVKEFGRLDIMVNNAGIFPMKPVFEMDTSFWEGTQHVNVLGVFLCSREAAKAMGDKGGTIINITSIDAIKPSMVGLAAYDASKHAVWGFTKNFALEAASKNIRVNAIAPGAVRTEGVEELSGGEVKAFGHPEAPAFEPAECPMKRMADPDEIATVALFLASDASSYMTGSMITVDGGMLLT
ncbi:MAG: SDR family NAD(P)-dependent oxidoreductase [Patescibacteria group bacterium]